MLDKVEGLEGQFKKEEVENMRVINKYSQFKTKEDIFAQFAVMPARGTRYSYTYSLHTAG